MISVRCARVTDAGTIVELVRALAEYEKEPLAGVKITPDIVRRDGFGPQRKFEALIAEDAGHAAGFALFFPNYSTWEGRAGLYIEDLFVREEARGRGLGRALMTAVAAIAQARGCSRIDLNVLDWNPTRDFYHRVGVQPMCDDRQAWLPYRMRAPEIAALAATADPAWKLTP